MRSYVIGANGFLGRHLMSWLGKSGDVCKAPAFDAFDHGKWQEAVLNQMREFAPDVVLIPGASQAMADDASSLLELIAANCVLPCLVAQHMLEYCPKSKLVVFGTSWQFADFDSYRPFNLYAASKQAGQNLLEHYALRGLRILQLILFDTYAENDIRRKLLNILRDACIHDEEISTTFGEQEIDLVHIDDVCTGVELAIRDLETWDSAQGTLILGLGSGAPILVKELISRVAESTGKKLRANIGTRPYREREVMKTYKRFRRPTGWSPKRTEFQDATVTKDQNKN